MLLHSSLKIIFSQYKRIIITLKYVDYAITIAKFEIAYILKYSFLAAKNILIYYMAVFVISCPITSTNTILFL